MEFFLNLHHRLEGNQLIVQYLQCFLFLTELLWLNQLVLTFYYFSDLNLIIHWVLSCTLSKPSWLSVIRTNQSTYRKRGPFLLHHLFDFQQGIGSAVNEYFIAYYSSVEVTFLSLNQRYFQGQEVALNFICEGQVDSKLHFWGNPSIGHEVH